MVMSRIYVALKIVVAREVKPNRELRILQSLAKYSGSHPGARHIVDLLDHLEIEGPNGTHIVLIMEVVGHVNDVFTTRDFAKDWKLFCHQLLSGVSFLHEHGITHAGMVD